MYCSFKCDCFQRQKNIFNKNGPKLQTAHPEFINLGPKKSVTEGKT